MYLPSQTLKDFDVELRLYALSLARARQLAIARSAHKVVFKVARSLRSLARGNSLSLAPRTVGKVPLDILLVT